MAGRGDNAGMNTLRIATRKSPLALWQSEHVADATARRASRPGRRTGADEHPRRRGAGPLAGGDRRQGPVPQGTGTGDAARRGRLRGAFAQGRADGAGAGLRAAGDPAARRPCRRLRQQPLRRHRRAAAGRARRYLVVAAAGAVARAAAGPATARPARQRQHAPGQARCRRLRRDRAGLRGTAAARVRRTASASRLDAPDWLPAPAQGAIAVECRDDDAATQALFAALDDAPTRAPASRPSAR